MAEDAISRRKFLKLAAVTAAAAATGILASEVYGRLKALVENEEVPNLENLSQTLLESRGENADWYIAAIAFSLEKAVKEKKDKTDSYVNITITSSQLEELLIEVNKNGIRGVVQASNITDFRELRPFEIINVLASWRRKVDNISLNSSSPRILNIEGKGVPDDIKALLGGVDFNRKFICMMDDRGRINFEHPEKKVSKSSETFFRFFTQDDSTLSGIDPYFIFTIEQNPFLSRRNDKWYLLNKKIKLSTIENPDPGGEIKDFDTKKTVNEFLGRFRK